MTWDPYSRAYSGSYEEYVENYDPRVVDDYRARGRGEPLLRSISNPSPVDRVGIASFLLDQGMDASVVESGDRTNALHVLLGVRSHDFKLEAPLLERILDGGADINLRSPRFGRPLEMLCRLPVGDADAEPFYEVFFSRPDIRLDLLVRREPPFSQRDILMGVTPELVNLHSHAEAYLAAHAEVVS